MKWKNSFINKQCCAKIKEEVGKSAYQQNKMAEWTEKSIKKFTSISYVVRCN